MMWLKHLRRRLRARREKSELAELLLKTKVFDPDFYLKSNPDLSANSDPLTHYLSFGRHEGRIPCADFDLKAYQAEKSSLAASGGDPLLQYLRRYQANAQSGTSVGQRVLRAGIFDSEFYRAAYLDSVFSGMSPEEHYLRFGVPKNRRPSLNFDPAFYTARYLDLQAEGVNPTIHYVEFGQAEGRLGSLGLQHKDLAQAIERIQSSGLFDKAYYLQQCPAVADAEIDPLFHYLVSGYDQLADPSPAFSTRQYLRSHPEVGRTRVNPLLHSLQFDDSRAAGMSGDPTPVRSVTGDRVEAERFAGSAYFERYRFTEDSTESAPKYAQQAVSDLAACTPLLTIEPSSPDVSILIPVYGQLHFVLNCLDSLSRQISRFSAEIIIGDDVSPDETGTRELERIPWIRYRRRESNGGFLDTCNDLAAMARGRYLVFLNSDTRVADGWLDELIGSFESFPKAGLIGSKLFNADGSLQEAGGIYWRDGSGWNYGRGDNLSHPKYCFARQADYISGAAIAIAAPVWKDANGFDIAFRPAYCEDADLAFRVRQMGYEVWFQPLSCVIHYEGKTHGRDLNRGVKAYQKVNSRRMAERWKAVLDSHAQPGSSSPDVEANRRPKSRALVLDGFVVAPDRDSGSFITLRMVKALQQLGYHVVFVPQFTYEYDKKYTTALQRLGVECLYQPYFHSIQDVLDFRSDFDLVLAYRFNVLENIYDELRARLPLARIVFHNVDLHFLREEREAALYNSRALQIAAAVTKASELELIAKVDCTIVHTKVETEVIRKFLPDANVVEFPYIAELHPTHTGFNNRHNVFFLGNFTHPPNGDAVNHFVTAIWPLVEHRLPPEARFLIAGANVTGDIKGLAGPRIEVVGHVEDLEKVFDTARVFVAPLRYGAGIKGKVIQALAYGAPSVITSVAAEGIGLASGHEAMIADNPQEFAAQLLAVYSDEELWRRLQTNGYQFVEGNYSWQRCLELFNKVLDTADSVWLGRHEVAMLERLKNLNGGSS